MKSPVRDTKLFSIRSVYKIRIKTVKLYEDVTLKLK